MNDQRTHDRKEQRADQDRTELYEREMKHEEHRETPLETAGRDAAGAEGQAEESRREREESRRERSSEEDG